MNLKEITSILFILTLLIGCGENRNNNAKFNGNDICNDPKESYMINNFEAIGDIYRFLEQDMIYFSRFDVKEGEYASIEIRNKDKNRCPILLSLASYKMHGNKPKEIVKYKETRIKIPYGTQKRVKVKMPDCIAEVGLYILDPEDESHEPPKTQKGVSYMNSLIGWTYQYNTKDIPEENDALNGWDEYDRFPGESDDTGQSIGGLHRRYDDDDGHSGAKPEDHFCLK
jgi:hypothetical protein